MAKRKTRSKFFDTRYFGMVIAAAFVVLFVAVDAGTELFNQLERQVVDLHFRTRDTSTQRTIGEGVSVRQRDLRISEDILILGIDFRTLQRFGRWPFSRSVHASLLNTIGRILDQRQRERAVFLDIFFTEPSEVPVDDVLLLDAIWENDRVYLETILSIPEVVGADVSELYERHTILFENIGSIENVTGPWQQAREYRGLQPPLQPYAAVTHGYGHAVFQPDSDEVFRSQPLVGRATELVGTIDVPIGALSAQAIREALVAEQLSYDPSRFERLAWIDNSGFSHTFDEPVTDEVVRRLLPVLAEQAPTAGGNDGPESYRFRVFRDHFVPSITLALAADYLHIPLDDIEVVLGSHIRLANPQTEQIDIETGEAILVPYRIERTSAVTDEDGNVVEEAVFEDVPEIVIPIDEDGDMRINFMGPRSSANPMEHQTFPVRSYSAYAARDTGVDPNTWPADLRLHNKIIMVGAFTDGMAADEKMTPFGLMYGVEMHANGLNTILMNRFIVDAPTWANIALMTVLAILIAFVAGRLSTILSLVITFVTVVVLFFTSTLVFDYYAYVIEFIEPALAVVLSLVAVIAYRVITEEADKRRIKAMFGKYVSPAVVEQMMDAPPELGGVDRELSVFFSDIRGFTTLSESMTPQELVNHLNLYLSAMTDIIMEYHGTLDKYVGDEVMCFWGAPLPHEDHALLACKCAIRQMNTLHQMNDEWPPERRINIGIGINSGIMTVGNMGSAGRMNYTLMGDNVNIGARLEGTNKQYMTNIIISEYTYGLVRDRVIARELDNIRVKGKNKPITIYELIDVPEGLDPPKDVATKRRHREPKE